MAHLHLRNSQYVSCVCRFLLWDFRSIIYLKDTHQTKQTTRLKQKMQISLHIQKIFELGRVSCYHLLHLLCWSRISYSSCSRTVSRKVLNDSKDGDSRTTLGNLLVLDHPQSKESFLTFKSLFQYFRLCPLPFVLSLNTPGKSLAPPSSHQEK